MLTTDKVVVKLNLFQDLMHKLMADIRGYIEAAKLRHQMNAQWQEGVLGKIGTFFNHPYETVLNVNDDPDMTESKLKSSEEYEKAFMQFLSITTTGGFATSDWANLITTLCRTTVQTKTIMLDERTKAGFEVGRYDASLDVNINILKWMQESSQLEALMVATKHQRTRIGLEKEIEDEQVKAEAEIIKIEKEAAEKLEKEKEAALQEGYTPAEETKNNTVSSSQSAVAPKPIYVPPHLKDKEQKLLKQRNYQILLAKLFEFLYRQSFELRLDAAKAIEPKISYKRQVPTEISSKLIDIIISKIIAISASAEKFENTDQVFGAIKAHVSDLGGASKAMHDSLWLTNPILQEITNELDSFVVQLELLDPLNPATKKSQRKRMGIDT